MSAKYVLTATPLLRQSQSTDIPAGESLWTCPSIALTLLHFIYWSAAATYGAGAFVGFLCWLGLIAATQFPQGIYENRPFKLFAINSGYWLVGLLIIGGLLAVWR